MTCMLLWVIAPMCAFKGTDKQNGQCACVCVCVEGGLRDWGGVVSVD